MASSTATTLIPTGWPAVSDDVIETAKRAALTALGEGAVRRLVDYYDVEGNYVGATFTELAPNEWNDITATDLHATSLMNVKIDARSTRRLTGGADRQWAVAELRKLPDRELLVADAATLEAMYDFYLAVKNALASPFDGRSNSWVTASKLCARKRPDLFPVRDRVVCSYLGLLKLADVRLDWQVFRALIQDAAIQQQLVALPDALREAAGERTVVIEHSDLRLLDAALWTYARDRDTASAETEAE